MDAPMARQGPAWSLRAVLGLLAFAIGYFALARLGLLFAFSDSLASPIWPPTGLAIAFGVLWGRRVLPAVFAGAFAVEYGTTASPWLSLALASGNTLEAALGSWLVLRAGGTAAFQSVHGVVAFAGAVLVAPLPAATAGMSGLVLSGMVPTSAAATIWWTWYLGDAAGAFVVAPVILVAWEARRTQPVGAGQRWLELAGLGVVAFVMSVVVFGILPSLPGLPLLFLLMPIVVWSALRQGPAITACLLMAFDVVAVAATRAGQGPFAGADPNTSFLLLQAFVFTMGFMALALAALASERRRAADELEARVLDRTTRLAELSALLHGQADDRRRLLEQVDEAQRAAHIGTWHWDIAKPQAEWSPELYRIYGLHPTDHVPTYEDYLTRVHPDDVERVKAATEAVFRDHKPYSHDERIRRPDGSWRDLHTWAQAVVGPDGRLVALAGACQDITDRKAAERALQESLERFRALADASPIGIVHTRADGVVDYVNDRWRQITGVADHNDREAMRKSVHPEDQPAAAELWRACVKEGREFSSDMRFVHHDGAVRWTRARAVPVRDAHGAITGFVSALADITDQRAAEAKDREVRRLREQAEFKTNFLRTAAHELGTPLTPITIQMRILRDLLRAPGRGTASRDEERKAVEILDRNIGRLHVLVRDMLESARLQSGRLKLAVRPMDMAHVVHEVVETFQEPAIQTGIALDMQGATELPMTGDPDRLSQVLYNLLANAMKFTPVGGSIHVRVAPDGDDSVRVTVQDTGSGFTREQAAQLCQPFVQLEDPRHRVRMGSGLGLYISRGIVEQHGGKLTCESAGPGMGATFTFTVPAVTQPLAPVALPIDGLTQDVAASN